MRNEPKKPQKRIEEQQLHAETHSQASHTLTQIAAPFSPFAPKVELY